MEALLIERPVSSRSLLRKQQIKYTSARRKGGENGGENGGEEADGEAA